ncbi:MAG: type II toxin-antitoxin system Phd/YefM family antitoxin [Phycisphaera sp.]|nr:MAG: type II toxin-antitoxin system Phd/YefM family antitoxin [Phycisphaera sp.]
MTRTDDITTASDYRSHQADTHAKLRETGRPIFITNRGRPEAVLLSPEAYDELLDQAQLPEILAAIRQSEQEFADGKGVDAFEAIQGIAERHGLTLDR